jgi:hypothetical protein
MREIGHRGKLSACVCFERNYMLRIALAYSEISAENVC